MSFYSVRGFTAATGAGGNTGVASLWNPSGTIVLHLYEIHIYRAGTTGTRLGLHKITARGTAGSTVTPDANNDHEALEAPRSGALLDLSSFSVQPTKATPPWSGTNHPSATGAGGAGMCWKFPRGWRVPPGTGVLIENTVAVVWPTSEVTFLWEENS